MCRMIGVISKVPVSVTPFLRQLSIQAQHGNHAPHGDGYGVGFFLNGGIHLSRSVKPLHMSELPADSAQTANILVLHARKAGVGKVHLANVHPFSDKLEEQNYLFAHNGTVKDINACGRHLEELESGKICDSKIAFERVMEVIMEGYSTEVAMRMTIQELEDACTEISALNWLMTDGTKLYASRYHYRDGDYYSLYHSENENTIVISTEPFDWEVCIQEKGKNQTSQWRLLDNRTVSSFAVPG